MENPNILSSDVATLIERISPVSQAAGTVTTGWIDASKFDAFLAEIQTGVLGVAATVDAKLQQATDSGGTGAKDVTNKAITQLVKATNDNNEVAINCRAEELDINNGFKFFRLSITVGAAASLIAAEVFGLSARHQPATAKATFVQAVA